MMKIIAVLSPSLVLTSNIVIVATLGKIAEAFPHVPESVVQLLTALPALPQIPIVFLSGVLNARFTKKQIVLTSELLLIFGGLFPLIFHTKFWMLMFGAVVMGLGFGGLSSLTSALIVEHFEGRQQLTLLGIQGTVIGVGGLFYSRVTGVLLQGEWWHVYYAHFLLIPIFILSLFLPRGSLAVQKGGSFRSVWNKKLTTVMIQSLLFSTFFFVFQANIAMLIAQLALGSDTLASNALFVHSVIGILTGFVDGRLQEKFKGFALPAFMSVAAVGLLSLYLSPGAFTVYLCAVTAGFAHNLRMSAGYLKAKSTVPAEAATVAMTSFGAASTAGHFFSPIVINALSGLLGFGIRERFLLAGGILLAVCAVSFRLEKKERAAVTV